MLKFKPQKGEILSESSTRTTTTMSTITTTAATSLVMKQSYQTLKNVKVFIPGRDYVITCFSNRSREEYPKFEWFRNDQPLLVVSPPMLESEPKVQAFGNELIINDVDFDLNGDYFSCRSYLDDEVFNEYIWPVRVLAVKSRAFYARVNAPYAQKRVGDSLDFSCYAVSKVSATGTI